jgi:S-formylglutathione hydrolase
VSAFAPITNPINAPWGQKAFKGYFGDDQQEKWKEHDATELVKKWKGPLDILIDVVRQPDLFPIAVPVLRFENCVILARSSLTLEKQGTGDNFYKQGQLLPENFIEAAKSAGVDKGINLRMQPDYDHSYYFMATFSDDHVDHAAKYLFA